MQYLGYIFFRFVVLLFYLMPFRVMYVLSDGLSWLFYKVVKYRWKVVYNNLKNSFPEKSEAEIQAIARKSYANLADILLESIKGFSMTEADFRKRYVFTNPEIVNDDHSAGGSSIHMAAHYTNWEWGAICYALYVKRHVLGFYKPLSNPYLEKYGFEKRSALGTILVSIKQTARTFEDYKDKPSAYILVSDQSPTSQKSFWIRFLNQDTACLHGGDKYAREFNYPVYFVEMRRVKRGYYEVSFEKLMDNPAALPEGELTRIYMARVEKMIRQKPEDWLWSHKRWKAKKPDDVVVS